RSEFSDSPADSSTTLPRPRATDHCAAATRAPRHPIHRQRPRGIDDGYELWKSSMIRLSAVSSLMCLASAFIPKGLCHIAQGCPRQRATLGREECVRLTLKSPCPGGGDCNKEERPVGSR